MFKKYGKLRPYTLEKYKKKYSFFPKNRDLFNYEKSKEVYIKNKVIHIFVFKK